MNDELKVLDSQQIQNKIITVRGKQVIIDRDLAFLYRVETRVLNQAVKRNIDRFPTEFMFQLTAHELTDWKSQIVISNKEKMGLRKSPYAFTEQGVAMLSAVLRSETAIQISIQIIDAFVKMRRFLSSNGAIFNRIDSVEKNLLEYKTDSENKFNQIFEAIEKKDIKPKQGIFFDGQIFDAYKFVSELFRSANSSIIIIDNYIDDSVLTHLKKKKNTVTVTIYTKNIPEQLELDVAKFNAQYKKLTLKKFNKSHDRFIIIDDKDVYHFGASLKDLGKKWFAFSKFEKSALLILEKLD